MADHLSSSFSKFLNPYLGVYRGWNSDQCHPSSPMGGGGPGSFKIPGPLRYTPSSMQSLPHPLSPSGMSIAHHEIIGAARTQTRSTSMQSLKMIAPTQGLVVKLTVADFQAAANALGTGVSVAIIQSFAEVESGGKSGFGPAGLPIIAYEGNIFRKLTGKKYDKTHPFLSYAYLKKVGPEWQRNNKHQKQGKSW